MNKIRVVFIDIDDTLLDFGQSSKWAMEKGFARIGVPFKDEYFDIFHTINSGLWLKIETGELTRKQLLQCRWEGIFARLGIDYDSAEFEKIFGEYLSESCAKVEGADEMLEYLAPKYKLYVASNGMADRQFSRLRSAGFYDYFTDVFVSEAVGYEKPDPKFFDFAFERIPGVKREESVFIGDSLTADVAGGKAAGIKTCWFDKKNTGDDKGMKPDYVIKSLAEIKNIL